MMNNLSLGEGKKSAETNLSTVLTALMGFESEASMRPHLSMMMPALKRERNCLRKISPFIRCLTMIVTEENLPPLDSLVFNHTMVGISALTTKAYLAGRITLRRWTIGLKSLKPQWNSIRLDPLMSKKQGEKPFQVRSIWRLRCTNLVFLMAGLLNLRFQGQTQSLIMRALLIREILKQSIQFRPIEIMLENLFSQLIALANCSEKSQGEILVMFLIVHKKGAE
jgi:hypothetical protein